MRHLFPEWSKTTYRWLRYPVARKMAVRERTVRPLQEALLNDLTSGDERKLILFIVPGADKETGKDTISGGVMSIVSICEESAHLTEIHGAKCFVCTLRGDALFTKHENFENNTPVLRFEQFPKRFPKLESIMIHLPEFMAERFGSSLSKSEKAWWDAIPERSINVLNQNIKLMPGPEQISTLKSLASTVTITTAHQKYCNQEIRTHYGVPLHKLSVWISPEQYRYKTWVKKENLLVYSPDKHPDKESVLERLKSVPGLQLQEIKGLTYTEYKELISEAKWSLTFGEGLDGYFIEPIFSGAISMAVYNDKFFTPDFRTLPGVFASWEELRDQAPEFMLSLEQRGDLDAMKQQQFDICARYYSKEQYRKNIAAFYERSYTYA